MYSIVRIHNTYVYIYIYGVVCIIAFHIKSYNLIVETITFYCIIDIIKFKMRYHCVEHGIHNMLYNRTVVEYCRPFCRTNRHHLARQVWIRISPYITSNDLTFHMPF